MYICIVSPILTNIVNHLKSLPIRRNSKHLISQIDMISNYIKNVGVMNKSTADEYFRRLNSFKIFISNVF
jgi:hypothetical protein